MSVLGQTTIIRRKKRRRRRRLPLFPFVFLAIAVVGAVFGVRWILSYRRILAKESLPAGYIVDAGTIKREYVNYYGKPETNGHVTERFREAADAARKRNIAGATSVLETAVKEGALPAVFHDLGVGYAALGDFPRAADAFREVLARDPEYAPTRLYLHSSKSIFAGAAEPYGREQEPNNDQSTANLIAVRSAAGAIQPATIPTSTARPASNRRPSASPSSTPSVTCSTETTSPATRTSGSDEERRASSRVSARYSPYSRRGTNEPPVSAGSRRRTKRRKSSGSSSNALIRPAGTFKVWLADGVR